MVVVVLTLIVKLELWTSWKWVDGWTDVHEAVCNESLMDDNVENFISFYCSVFCDTLAALRLNRWVTAAAAGVSVLWKCFIYTELTSALFVKFVKTVSLQVLQSCWCWLLPASQTALLSRDNKTKAFNLRTTALSLHSSKRYSVTQETELD